MAKPSSYEILQEKVKTISASNHTNGIAYIASGSLVLALSIPGYYLSQDVFAKAVYSVGETLSVTAIGYGFYLVSVDDEYVRFHHTLEAVPDLTSVQREKLARSFIQQSATQAKHVRKLKVITHSLVAGLNALNALTVTHRELKLTLFFLGGVNTVVALGNLFGTSEEEDLAATTAKIDWTPTFGGLAVRVQF